jgi:uncharacterized protein (DUF1778 family)
VLSTAKGNTLISWPESLTAREHSLAAAASLSGISASDFIRMATRQAALNTIREHEVLTLNEEAKRVFVEALLNPPKPNEKAIAAARRLKEEIA